MNKTTTNVSTLKIHKFKTVEQYESAVEQGAVTETDICLIDEDFQILYCGTSTDLVD